MFVSALGFIGTTDAESALNSLLGTPVDEKRIAGALICCGSASGVSKAVELARSKHNPKWLCECIGNAFRFRGWRAGRYYPHGSTGDLVDYLASEEPQMAPGDKLSLMLALRRIDSDKIRQLLRQWASREGSLADSVIREGDGLRLSSLCYEELMYRGDACAIPHVLCFSSQRTG